MSDIDPAPRAFLLELLLDLANDASSYLRRNASRAVRVSAAVLVAASIAACNATPFPQIPGRGGDVVQPLNQEVRRGLPAQPGRYPIADGSVRRDAQGVYQFDWLSGTARNTASASRLRLAQSDASLLEVPPSGDPILYLPSQAAIPLGGTGGLSGSYGTWYPFSGISSRTAGYYDPPSQAIAQGGTVSGSRISSAPVPAGERTVGLPHTVSGRAGGTGTGQAASVKSGAGTAGSSKGVGAAKSGGFSSGRGGGAGGSGG